MLLIIFRLQIQFIVDAFTNYFRSRGQCVYKSRWVCISPDCSLSLSVELLQSRPLDRKLSPDIPVLCQLKLIHIATPDTTKLSRLCCIRFGGVNWIPDNSRLSPTENLKPEHVQSNRPIHIATPDTTQTGPSCRVLVWRCELSRPDCPTSAFSVGVCRAA